MAPIIKHGVPIANNSGMYLEMAALYYWSGNAVAAPFMQINAGDTLEVQVSGASCNSSGGGCTWYLSIYDDNRGVESQFYVVSSPAYTTIIGGMLASAGAMNCAMLFANHNLAFRGLIAYDDLGNVVTPSFYRRVADQECSMNLASVGPTGGNIYWTP